MNWLLGIRLGQVRLIQIQKEGHDESEEAFTIVGPFSACYDDEQERVSLKERG